MIQISVSQWMSKQKMVYLHQGIVFDSKNGQNADTCFNIDEPSKHYTKWKKPLIETHILYYFLYVK